MKTSCTGHCNQGRACTCNPRMGEISGFERFLLNNKAPAMIIGGLVAVGWVKLLLLFI